MCTQPTVLAKAIPTEENGMITRDRAERETVAISAEVLHQHDATTDLVNLSV